MVATFIMLSKLATLGFIKYKVFWNKGCDVKIAADDVTYKVLSGGSNYIVDMVMRPKLL